ncbi:MAG: hypothetical protein AAGH90_03700 [Pseudomonadota bacterium]
MKRLIATFMVSSALVSLPAQASPELAAMWGDSAASLEQQTAEMITAIDLGGRNDVSEDYILGVSRFGRTSGGLAKWNDASGGPHDLGCIFRGMATESEDQTLALIDTDDAVDARGHLERLEAMFSDAQLIAKAAIVQSPTPSLLNKHKSEACPMELEAARRALQN